MSRGVELGVTGAVAAVWFGVPAAVVAARTAPGDKPGAGWVVGLLASVVLLGAAGGALVGPRRSWPQAAAVAAALAVGLVVGIAVPFATSTSCGVENHSCDTLAAVGSAFLGLLAFVAFLPGVHLGRLAARRRGR
jgi:hypothetical protein